MTLRTVDSRRRRRRAGTVAALIGRMVLPLAVLVACSHQASSAEEGKAAAAADAKSAPAVKDAPTSPAPEAGKVGSANLPLKKVVLFSSGVGYFEHAGKVRDQAKVEFNFRVDDINDLLKSMVVQDLDGGQVSTVSYGSKDPVEKTLKSFAIDLTTNPTMGKLLQQVRGERVEIDAPNKITGVIIGVESRKEEIGKDKVVEIEQLNLLTDEGLRSVGMATISRIKLVDPKLDAELRKALAVLATSHATDKKAVALNFLGKGERQVRVGYVQETPVWKTSYRLVLEDEKPAFLQGWAIVENTTEEDWSDVRLTLVSGRPISFVMDLYQPLYVSRPVVEMELYASLRPQVYQQDLASREAEFRKKAEAAAPAAAPALARAPMAEKARRAAGRGLDRAADMPMEEQAEGLARADLRQTARSLATAGNVGELFQYAISTPVNLARRQSAMLPIVNGDVKGEKVSIYNPRVHAKHPLNGLKLTNSTELNLMQGPITVFDDGAYAGDAKIEDLPPKSERLISYAMDLDTEVAPESKGAPEQLINVRISKGTLFVERKHARTQEYTVKNSGRKPKKVLVEQPLDPTWTLVSPKEPAEKTRDTYRFAVAAKPGEPAKLAIEEERIDRQQIGMSNLDDNTILMYQSAKIVSEKVKAALAEVVKRRHEMAQVAAKRSQLEQQVRAIEEEQNRIRQNMDKLDRNGDLYKRYVKKFSDQEDEIEKLRAGIKEFVQQEAQLRKSLDEFLMGLELP